VKSKKEEREFQEENISQIIEALQGDGLMNLLSYLVTQEEKYGLERFGESPEPCRICGERYIFGRVYRADKKENVFKGFDAADLHHLAKHPETFINKYGNLRRIYDTLSDAEGHEAVFVSHPDIMPEFNAFAAVYSEYLDASGKAFDFWMETEGGIRREEEEIEDSPELQALQAKEKELNANEEAREKKASKALRELQDKYDRLTGTKNAEGKKDWQIRKFWTTQIMLFNIYHITAPKLLTEFAGQHIMEEPVKLYKR
jgi:hypothetical protein